MTSTPAKRAASALLIAEAETQTLGEQIASARGPLAQIYARRAIGFFLLGLGILLGVGILSTFVASLFAAPAWQSGPWLFVTTVFVSLTLSLLGFRLLTPRFSLLFLRHFGDDSIGTRVRALLPSHLSLYFKVLALYDEKTNPVSTFRAEVGGCALAFLAYAVWVSAIQLLIAGSFSVSPWIALPLLFLISRKITPSLTGRILRSANHIITSREHLTATFQAVERWLHRRLVVSKTMVLYVGPEVPKLWREVVTELAVKTDVVILDLSVVSDSVAWEIESLLPQLGGRAVLFGKSAAVREWLDRESSSESDPAARIRACLAGRQILVEQAGWRGHMRFYRQVTRAALSAAAAAS